MKKKKVKLKKSTISKKDNNRHVKLSDGRKLRVDESSTNPTIAEVAFPDRKMSDKDYPEPKDEGTKHRYPPPRRNPVFRKNWMGLIDYVMTRSNFKEAHLDMLKVFCDLLIAYEETQEFLQENGSVYKTTNRLGHMWKTYPQVALLERTQSLIRTYTGLLGLDLRKMKAEEGFTPLLGENEIKEGTVEEESWE